MNKTLTITAIIGAVALAQIGEHESLEEGASNNGPHTQIQYRPGGGGHRGHGPSFLRNVTMEARTEYFSILRNSALTIAQQKMEIVAWADRNGVAEQLAAFNLNKTLIKEEMRQNITQLLSELPSAVQRMQEIIDNEEQTYAQQYQALRSLTMENPTLYHAAKFVSDSFSRPCCRGRGGPPAQGDSGAPGRQMESMFVGYEEGMQGTYKAVENFYDSLLPRGMRSRIEKSPQKQL